VFLRNKIGAMLACLAVAVVYMSETASAVAYDFDAASSEVADGIDGAMSKVGPFAIGLFLLGIIFLLYKKFTRKAG